MSGIWLVSFLALWALVLFEAFVMFVLIREFGVRMLGTAAGLNEQGIAIGSRAPDVMIEDEHGRRPLRPEAGRSLMLVFGSRRCQPCRALAPDLNKFGVAMKAALDVRFVVDEAVDGAVVTARDLELVVPVVASENATERYEVPVTPFAFLIDGNGVVRAKGIASNRHALELLWARGSGDKYSSLASSVGTS